MHAFECSILHKKLCALTLTVCLCVNIHKTLYHNILASISVLFLVPTRCTMDQTVQVLSPRHEKHFQFSMEAFKFIGSYDQVNRDLFSSSDGTVISTKRSNKGLKLLCVIH